MHKFLLHQELVLSELCDGARSQPSNPLWLAQEIILLVQDRHKVV